MRIKRINIRGFKNIQNVTITFEKLAVLVSENSYGKSNLMTAIDFAVDFIHGSNKKKAMMMKYEAGIPLNSYTESQNFHCEFEFDDVYEDRLINYVYGFEFVWEKNDKSGAKVVSEWLNYKESGVKQKYTKLISRSENSFYKASLTGRCRSLINVDETELIINKLLMYENLFYYDVIYSINFFQVYVERHLDASVYFDIDPIIRKEATNEIDIQEVDNIPRTIYFLKQKHKAKYELLVNSFFQLFPNITKIDVKEFDISKSHSFKISGDAPYTISNKVYSLYVKDKNINQPIDFRWLSDGAKRIFLMLTYAIVADINDLTLIAFEEPENSIHPALLQNYLDILYQLSDNCAIICASHSPYVLQYVNTNDIYVGKPNNKGLADFSKIDSKKIPELLKDAVDNSNSVGNYIFELLSGGEDDIEILLEYLEN